MKKSAIIILIVSLIVFVTSLTAAITLTVRTNGWDDLGNVSRFGQNIDNLVSRGSWIDLPIGSSVSHSIDKIHEIDPQGISEIHITGLSESILISAADNQISARLEGTYTTRTNKVEWEAKTSGSTLYLNVKYPRYGLRFSQMSIHVAIPSQFSGIVKVNTLSGTSRLDVDVTDRMTAYYHDSLSGSLRIENGGETDIIFSTLSGSVDIAGLNGKVSGETMSGNVNIELDNLHTFDVETLSGDITLTLPAATDADINFSTLSGSFDSKNLTVETIRQERRLLLAKLNQGGQKIDAETLSGDFTMIGR